MYGSMNMKKAEYSVQPSYNESFVPNCPPSYSEAVASSSHIEPSAYQSVLKDGEIVLDPSQPKSSPKSGVPLKPQLQPHSAKPQVITVPISVGPKAACLQCPHCHINVTTEVTKSSQKSAHYACFILCILGCCLCSCIPYCLASFKNIHHHCPACKSFIGTYRS